MRLKVGAWNSCTWRELCLAICRRHEAIMTRGGRSLACSKDSGELRAVTRGCRQRSAPIHVTRRTHQTSEAHRAAFAWTVSDDDRPPVRPSFDLLFGDDAARRACVVVSYSCEIARTFYQCVFPYRVTQRSTRNIRESFHSFGWKELRHGSRSKEHAPGSCCGFMG